MSFFDSEVVRAEMTEISELQEDVYRNVFEFSKMNREEQLFHVGLLEKLIEKQKIFYARAKLSDDPEAKSVVDTMKQGVIMLGATPDTSIEKMFEELVQKVASMKRQTEAGG